MRLKFHRGAVLLGMGIGFVVLVITIVLISLFTSPEQLIFIYPASFLWIILLILAIKFITKTDE